MGSLWIGPLGRLKEIRDAATEFDRSVSLGVEPFAALGGGITVTRLAEPPRRLSLSWKGLADDTARWLEAMARRVYGPGPLAVLDPASRNLFEGGQSQGYAPRAAWALAGFGTLTERPDRTVTLAGTQATSQLYFQHSHWLGWPIAADVPVHFASSLSPGNGLCRLEFFAQDLTYLGEAGPAETVTALPPPGAVFVYPKINLKAFSGPVPVGPAVLRMGDPITPGEVAPIGDGCPAMTVTSYTDRATPPYRDLALNLVEVRRARS